MISRRRSSVVMATVSSDSTSALRVRVLGLGGGVSSGFAELRDLFGELVALGFEGFDLGDGVAALAVDGGEVGEDLSGVHAPGAEFFFDKGQICPDKC